MPRPSVWDPEWEELSPLTERVIGAAIHVHSTLGPGLLERVYQVCLARELERRGLRSEAEVRVPIVYEGEQMPYTLRLDLVVADRLAVEVKAVEEIAPIHIAQLATYLRLANLPLGLLLNFNTTAMRHGIRRVTPPRRALGPLGSPVDVERP